jgi:hypothetical protein
MRVVWDGHVIAVRIIGMTTTGANQWCHNQKDLMVPASLKVAVLPVSASHKLYRAYRQVEHRQCTVLNRISPY